MLPPQIDSPRHSVRNDTERRDEKEKKLPLEAVELDNL